MPEFFKYDYETDANILHLSITDRVFSVSDIELYMRKVLHDDNIKSGYVEVVDFSMVEDIKADSFDFIAVKQIFEQLAAKKGFAGTVAYVTSDYIYGMVRMMTVSFSEIAPLIFVRSKDDIASAIDQIRHSS